MNLANKKLIFAGLFCTLIALSAFCDELGVGGLPSSYAQPLTVDIGTRSNAMGGTGYALADDETALFYNPAGLGIKNERWQSGALTTSFKHSSVAEENHLGFWSLTFQIPELTNFGFSLYFDHYREESPGIMFEENPINLNSHRVHDESALAFGAGYSFRLGKHFLNSIGLGLKWYHESSGTKDAEPVWYANDFAFDCGYLLQIMDQFRIGLSLKNIGPNYDLLYYGKNVGQAALPFLTAASIGYKKSFITSKCLSVLDLSPEITFRKRYSEFPLENKNDSFHHFTYSDFLTGIDFCFLNTFSGRFGYTKDLNGIDEYSLSWGIGLSLFNHFDFDFFRQKEFVSGGYESPINEGFSTSYKRAFKWSRSDRKWWFDK